jgi:hypothetical protein
VLIIWWWLVVVVVVDSIQVGAVQEGLELEQDIL